MMILLNFMRNTEAGALIGADLARLVYHNGRSSYDVRALTACDLFTLKACMSGRLFE